MLPANMNKAAKRMFLDADNMLPLLAKAMACRTVTVAIKLKYNEELLNTIDNIVVTKIDIASGLKRFSDMKQAQYANKARTTE